MDDLDALFDELWEIHTSLVMADRLHGVYSPEKLDALAARRNEILISMSPLPADERDKRAEEARLRLVRRDEQRKKARQVDRIVEEMKMLFPHPPRTPTEVMIDAYRLGSPWGELRDLLHAQNPDWSDDSQSAVKAYIFACVSEIVYQHSSKYELPGRSRYKIIPSIALQKLLGDGIELDLAAICRSLGEFNLTIVESRSFVFGAFRMGNFNVIAVRGTTPILQDLMIDLDDRMLRINHRGFHAGFYNEAQVALPELIASINNPHLPLYFTGHSLGAAVAGILPLIWNSGWTLKTPYIFAAPRYSSENVARDQNVYSYARNLDPVPHLPLERSGFRSAGLSHTMVPPEDKWLRGLGFLWKMKLSAHSIETYRELIGRQVVCRQFAPTVYFDALQKNLTAGPNPY